MTPPRKRKPVKRNSESFLKHHWRPIAAFTYIIICLFDFMFAPMLMVGYSIYTHTALITWVPLTTSGTGIFHLSYGAILGVYAYGRSKEVLQGMTDNQDQGQNQ